MADPIKIKGFLLSPNLFFNGLPSSLSLETTNRCNLRCIHCSHSHRKLIKKGDMSWELFKKIERYLGETIHHVSLNGLGEPLLAKKWKDIFSICLDKKNLSTSFITNGTLPLDPQELSFDGRLSITFSIDGATSSVYKKIRLSDAFERVINNIKAIDKAKRERDSEHPILSAIFVVTTANMSEMPHFVRLCSEVGIKKIYFTHLVAHTLKQMLNLSAFFTPHAHDRYLSDAISIAEQKGISIIHMGSFQKGLIESSCPPESWLFKSDDGSITCSMIKDWCMVNYTGHIQVCCAPDALIAGDLRIDELKDIYNGATYRRLKTGLAESFDKTCGHVCNLLQTISLNDLRAFYCPIRETYMYDEEMTYSQPYIISELNTIYEDCLEKLTRGMLDETIQRCEEILATEPLAFEVYNLKAVALYLKGYKDAAVERLWDALKFNRQYQKALLNLKLMTLSDNVLQHLELLSDLPEPFNYYKAVLKSDHLHFGLWSEGVETIEEAQQKLTDRIFGLLPQPPTRILDVGCGLGQTAFEIANKGYEVIAIAPSEKLISYASSKYKADNLLFFVADYINLPTQMPFLSFDVLLFQESLQYLSPLELVFEKARKLLKDTGIIVLCDEICYESDIKPKTAVHLKTDLIIAIAEKGFKTTHSEKLGEGVSPTCDYIIRSFTERFDEIATTCGQPSRLNHFLDGWKLQKSWYSDKKIGYEIVVTKKDSFFAKPYTAGDELEILPLFNQIFNVHRTIDHWLWKYRDNPYGAFKIATMCHEKSKIVAHYAGYPVPFYDSVTKREFLSYHIGDTMTVPEFRRVGIGKTGLLARLAEYYYAKFCSGLPFIYGFNTGKIKKLGQMYLNYQYASPVGYYTLDLTGQTLKKGILQVILNPYKIIKAQWIPGHWNDFFYEAAMQYRLLVKRDSTYMRWRYLDCPDKIHHLYLVYRGKMLVGFGVFARKNDTIVWGDGIFTLGNYRAIRQLLQTVCEDGYFKGCTKIDAWFSKASPQELRDTLMSLGFVEAQEPDNLFPCFVFFDKEHNPEQMDKDFYYTKGDSDLF